MGLTGRTLEFPARCRAGGSRAEKTVPDHTATESRVARRPFARDRFPVKFRDSRETALDRRAPETGPEIGPVGALNGRVSGAAKGGFSGNSPAKSGVKTADFAES